MKAAERTIPNFNESGEDLDNSMWWSWLDDPTLNIRNVIELRSPDPSLYYVPLRDVRYSSEHVFRSDNEWCYDLNARIGTNPEGSSGNCVIDVMLKQLECCRRMGVDRLVRDLAAVAKTTPSELMERGVSLSDVHSWVKQKRYIRMVVYNKFLRTIVDLPRRVCIEGPRRSSTLVFVVSGSHAFCARGALLKQSVIAPKETFTAVMVDPRINRARTVDVIKDLVATIDGGGGDARSEERGSKVPVRLLNVYVIPEQVLGGVEDEWDVDDVIVVADEDMLARTTAAVFVVGKDRVLQRQTNDERFWKGLFGQFGDQGNRIVIPVEDLSVLRLVLWQATGCLCTEQANPTLANQRRSGCFWSGGVLRRMVYRVIDGADEDADACVVSSHAIVANPYVKYLEERRDLWEPLMKSGDISIVSLQSVLSVYVAQQVTLSVAGHHQSTLRLWGGYRSSCIRGCLRNVDMEHTPDDHAALITVDARACFWTCMMNMLQPIPICWFDDVWVPVDAPLADVALVESSWYIVHVDEPGPPFLGLTSITLACVLSLVRQRTPSRRVTVLYAMHCDSERCVSPERMKSVCAALEAFSRGDDRLKKVAVAQWVGALARFRQPRQYTRTMVTETLSDFAGEWEWQDGSDGVVHHDTVIHAVFNPHAQRVGCVYDMRRSVERPVVANQSYLLIQLAIHIHSYLVLWDMERALSGLKLYHLVGYATDSVTCVVSPELARGLRNGDANVQEVMKVGFEVLGTPPCIPVEYHLEPESKTRGCEGAWKSYKRNVEDWTDKKGLVHNGSRSFCHEFRDSLFHSHRDLLRYKSLMNIYSPDDAVALMVCPSIEWDVYRFDRSSCTEQVLNRLDELLGTRQSLYLEGQGGSGKTYTIAQFIKRRWDSARARYEAAVCAVSDDEPAAEGDGESESDGTGKNAVLKPFLLLSFTHDGCAALAAAVAAAVPGFDMSCIQTVSHALYANSSGFGRTYLCYETVIVDECSMVGLSHWTYIANIMECQPGTKFVIAGDMLQHLNPVDPVAYDSIFFKTLCSSTRVELNMNHRLRDVPENAPVAAAIANMRDLIRRGVTDVSGVDLSFIQRDGRIPSMHLCFGNHEVKHLNDRMMVALTDDPDEYWIPKHPSNVRGQPILLYNGLKLVVRESEKKRGLWNKSQWEVVSFDRERGDVELKWIFGKAPHVVVERVVEGRGGKRKRGGAARSLMFDDDAMEVDEEESDEVDVVAGEAADPGVTTPRTKRVVARKISPKVRDALIEEAAEYREVIESLKDEINSRGGKRVKMMQNKLRAEEKRLARIEARLLEDDMARQRDKENLCGIANGNDDIQPEAKRIPNVVVSVDELARHFAPRYAMTSHAVQGRTLTDADFQRVMLHGVHRMDLRTLHVVVGRVVHCSQLAFPSDEQVVRCVDGEQCEFVTVKGSIYAVTHQPSSRVYVGQTLYEDATRRFEEHLACSDCIPLRECVAMERDAGSDLKTIFQFRVLREYEVCRGGPNGIENRELKYFENQWMAKLLNKGVTLFNERTDAACDEMFE